MNKPKVTYATQLSLLGKGACVCVLLLALAGCRPNGVLSSGEMRDVLYDLHRADGAIQIAGYNYSHNAELAAYYKSVLDKHGITQAQFDSSIVWYTNNPQIFNKIYPKVIERLEADYQIISEENDAQNAQNTAVALVPDTPAETTDTTIVPSLQELLHNNTFGLDNPWQIWKPKQADSCLLFNELNFKESPQDTLAIDTIIHQ